MMTETDLPVPTGGHILLRSEYTDYKLYDFECNIDPENNCCNSIDSMCDYYTEEKFNDTVNLDNNFSVIHFNCRSLYANFAKIQEYIRSFKHTFSVIALSETWLDEDRGVDFCMEGYELHHCSRRDKRGGGVALFVTTDFKCRIVECMTTAITDLFECVTVEIDMENKRNAVVTCIYRTPGSKIETFNEHLEKVLCQLNEKKMYILCGDVNIDLLSLHRQVPASDYLEMLYSRGLYPLITKPTRITSTCSTLIDHIFTNILESKTKSGVLINDISDHLPVFLVYNNNYKREKREKRESTFKYRRVRTEEAINTLKNELLNQNWEPLYKEENIDKGYEIFLGIFKLLYDKYCPIK